MGRMHDALRKAEAERSKRRKRDDETPMGDSAPDLAKTASEAAPPKAEEAAVTEVESTEVAAAPNSKTGRTKRAKPDPKSSRQTQHAAAKTVSTAAVQIDSSQTPRPGILGAIRKVSTPITSLTAIGPGNRLVALHSPNDFRVEQFRAVRSNLQALEPAPQVLGFTSALEGEGSSLVAANLACVFAEEKGTEILVVNANMRDADLHEILGNNPDEIGLSEVLAGECEALDVVSESAIPHVSFVGAGRLLDNPGGLLPSRRMTEAMAAWRRKYDFIFIDTPAISGVNDAAVIGHHVDGMVLVLKLGSTPRDIADLAISGLRGAGVRLLGCVVTNAESGTSKNDLG